jgi:hypothetical protein
LWVLPSLAAPELELEEEEEEVKEELVLLVELLPSGDTQAQATLRAPAGEAGGGLQVRLALAAAPHRAEGAAAGACAGGHP